LQHLLDLHATWDVVQCKRYDLARGPSLTEVGYADIQMGRDCSLPEGDYWRDFYNTPDWMKLPLYWKYVCSHALSLRTDVFKKVGWFKRCFIFYGFEDTELGYRLAQQNLKFHLSEAITYHLNHSDERSEFSNSNALRLQLLGHTARIFYHGTLNPKIYSD